MHLKVQNGTAANSDTNLCATCRLSTIVRGRSLDEEIVQCHARRCAPCASRSRSRSVRPTVTRASQPTCRCWRTLDSAAGLEEAPGGVHPRLRPEAGGARGNHGRYPPPRRPLRPRPPSGRERVVNRERLAGPGAHRRPWLRRRRPKRIRRREAERQQADRTQAQAPGRNIGLTDARLMPAEADLSQPLASKVPASIDRRIIAVRAPRTCAGVTSSGSALRSAICASN